MTGQPEAPRLLALEAREAVYKERIQVLEDALQPFGKLADAYHEVHLDRIRRAREDHMPDPYPLPDGHRVSVSMGQLRAAAKALQPAAST